MAYLNNTGLKLMMPLLLMMVVIMSLMIILVPEKFAYKPMRSKPHKALLTSLDKECKNQFKPETNSLKDILLAINYNHPHYNSIPVLEEFYRPVFPNFVFCGPEASRKYKVIVIEHPKTEYGYYGFECLVQAAYLYPKFAGYFYVSDDMIVNWWNFLNLDKTKIWFGGASPDVEHGHVMGSDPSPWFRRVECGKRCTESYTEMQANALFSKTSIFDIYMNNTGNRRVCIVSLSDIFYIPGRLAQQFTTIAQKLYDKRLFLEIAVPMTLYMLDFKENIILLNGIDLQAKYQSWGTWTWDTKTAWKEYNLQIHYLHPYKFSGNNQSKNTVEFKDNVSKKSSSMINESCLDAVYT